jgi:Lrp/AsnC family transcriptional regulator, leucine-responsive regulatory protein
MINFDETDKKILKVLNKEARKSIADISRITGIQRDSVMYRIQRMEKEKLILHYHAVLDPTLLNYPIYNFVIFELIYISEKEQNHFLAYLKSHKNVTYIVKMSGRWDLTINMVAKNLKEFDSIITEIRMKFSHIIKDYQTASIIEELKYDDMVELIEDSKKKSK